MAIEFKCTCGRTLSVPDEVAGSQAKCPGCQAVLTVPGEPPPEPEEAPEGKVDQVVEGFRAQVALSRERAPELTSYAIALACWWTAALVLMLLMSLLVNGFGIVMWLLVWLPQGVVAGLLIWGILRADYRVPGALTLAGPAIFGANYVMFWEMAIASGNSVRFIIPLIIALGNMAGMAFFMIYLRKPEVAPLFAVPAEPVEESPAEEQAQEQEPTR